MLALVGEIEIIRLQFAILLQMLELVAAYIAAFSDKRPYLAPFVHQRASNLTIALEELTTCIPDHLIQEVRECRE